MKLIITSHFLEVNNPIKMHYQRCNELITTKLLHRNKSINKETLKSHLKALKSLNLNILCVG